MNHEAVNKDTIYYKQNVIFLVSLKITCQLCILNTFCWPTVFREIAQEETN